MEWSFVSFLWTMFVFWVWVMVIWMFISVFADIFRRSDLSGWAKAGWIALVVLLPLIGILIYVIVRPKPTATAVAGPDAYGFGPQASQGVSTRSAVDEIAKAAQLRDGGAITEDEFREIKWKAMSGA